MHIHVCVGDRVPVHYSLSALKRLAETSRLLEKAWDSALLLLSKDADPNKAAKWIDRIAVRTPLYYAALRGSTKVCRSLLASGARQDIGGEYFVDYTGCPRKKRVQQ